MAVQTAEPDGGRGEKSHHVLAGPAGGPAGGASATPSGEGSG
jgi:hypothetical protein